MSNCARVSTFDEVRVSALLITSSRVIDYRSFEKSTAASGGRQPAKPGRSAGMPTLLLAGATLVNTAGRSTPLTHF